MAETIAETVTRCDKRRAVMLLKPFVCLKCGVHLGMTNGKGLQSGAAIILGTVAIKCGGCGAIRVWRPVKERGGDNGARFKGVDKG
jgi:hypothetical protein